MLDLYDMNRHDIGRLLVNLWLYRMCSVLGACYSSDLVIASANDLKHSLLFKIYLSIFWDAVDVYNDVSLVPETGYSNEFLATSSLVVILKSHLIYNYISTHSLYTISDFFKVIFYDFIEDYSCDINHQDQTFDIVVVFYGNLDECPLPFDFYYYMAELFKHVI